MHVMTISPRGLGKKSDDFKHGERERKLKLTNAFTLLSNFSTGMVSSMNNSVSSLHTTEQNSLLDTSSFQEKNTY